MIAMTPPVCMLRATSLIVAATKYHAVTVGQCLWVAAITGKDTGTTITTATTTAPPTTKTTDGWTVFSTFITFALSCVFFWISRRNYHGREEMMARAFQNHQRKPIRHHTTRYNAAMLQHQERHQPQQALPNGDMSPPKRQLPPWIENKRRRQQIVMRHAAAATADASAGISAADSIQERMPIGLVPVDSKFSRTEHRLNRLSCGIYGRYRQRQQLRQWWTQLNSNPGMGGHGAAANLNLEQVVQNASDASPVGVLHDAALDEIRGNSGGSSSSSNGEGESKNVDGSSTSASASNSRDWTCAFCQACNGSGRLICSCGQPDTAAIDHHDDFLPHSMDTITDAKAEKKRRDGVLAQRYLEANAYDSEPLFSCLNDESVIEPPAPFAFVASSPTVTTEPVHVT